MEKKILATVEHSQLQMALKYVTNVVVSVVPVIVVVMYSVACVTVVALVIEKPVRVPGVVIPERLDHIVVLRVQLPVSLQKQESLLKMGTTKQWLIFRLETE